MFPYLDVPGFKARSPMPPGDVDGVEATQPGFTALRISYWSSWVNARLRKRYGDAGAGKNSLPLGQAAPELLASGTAPPGVGLQGRPQLGSVQVQIKITTGGPLGTAQYAVSYDGGLTFSASTATAATVTLDRGLTATFGPGTYSTDNLYAAATPVPEIVLGWIVTLVTLDLYFRRGHNPNDPAVSWLTDRVTQVMAEITEAADSKDGLLDIPSAEDAGSAVTTGGPLGHSDASPYRWMDRQAQRGYAQDGGRDGGNPAGGVFGG